MRHQSIAKNRAKRALASLLLASVAGSLHARDTEETMPAATTGNENRQTQASLPTADLEPMRVVYIRGAQDTVFSLPQSIDIITRAYLDDNVFTNVEDALYRLPNIGRAPAEGAPNFWQQGFTIRGLGAQRVLTLTDGVRQSGQGVGYGGGNLSLYDVYGVEQIEVLKGPYSVMYGTDAIGGVINVITRSPQRRDTFGVNGATRFAFDSAQGLLRGGGMVDVGGEDYGLVMGGSYTSAGDPTLPGNAVAPGGAFTNQGFWGKFDFYSADNVRWRLLGNFSKDTDVAISNTTLPLLVPGPLDFNFPLYQRSELGGEVEVKDAQPWLKVFKAGLYWQQIRRQFDRTSPALVQQTLFGVPTAPRQESVNVLTDDRVNTYEFQTHALMNLGPHEIVVGIDAGLDTAYLPETETRQLTFNPLPPFLPVVPPFNPVPVDRLRADARQYRLGLYAQDTWSVADDWRLIGGVRGDFFDVSDDVSGFSTTEGGVSGNVAVVYDIRPDWMSYLNFGTGFRSPDLGERFQSTVVTVVTTQTVLGNPNLTPERSYSAEWGSKYEGENWQVRGAVFVNQVDNFIGTVQINPLTQQFQNVGNVMFYGTELEATVNPVDRVELFGNVGRTWTSNNTLARVANWTFNYGAAYTQPMAGFFDQARLVLYARTVMRSTDQTTAPNVEYGGFTTLNLQATFDFSIPSIETQGSLLVGVSNLANRSYREPFFNQIQPARSFYTALSFQF